MLFRSMWEKHITATTADFELQEETGVTKVEDGQKVRIGGMITDKKIKYTKNDKVMAFLNVEDLVGTVEVIVFPRDYEKNASRLVEDNKVFIEGRASVEEEKGAKLICEKMFSFDEVPKKLWIKYPDMDAYEAANEDVMNILATSEGIDQVIL